MIMTYDERKSAVLEDFEDFHGNMGYSLKETLYATIGEAEYSPLYSQTDKICIYIAFALTLINQREDISFLSPELEELTDEKYMPQYEQELGADFHFFQKDLLYLKKLFSSKG